MRGWEAVLFQPPVRALKAWAECAFGGLELEGLMAEGSKECLTAADFLVCSCGCDQYKIQACRTENGLLAHHTSQFEIHLSKGIVTSSRFFLLTDYDFKKEISFMLGLVFAVLLLAMLQSW